jgi:hypothetical protein
MVAGDTLPQVVKKRKNEEHDEERRKSIDCALPTAPMRHHRVATQR